MCDKRPMFVLCIYIRVHRSLHVIYIIQLMYINNNNNNNNRLYDCDGVETVYVLCMILL